MSSLNGDGRIHISGLSLDKQKVSPFGPHEEEAIIAFALDFPDAYISMIQYVGPELFNRIECQYVMAWIIKLYSKHDVIPTRQLLRDKIIRNITTDDPYKEILEIIDKKSNPRDVPIIRDTLKDWAESKQFGLLYSEEAIAAYHSHDYDRLREIFDGAARINDSGHKGFWFFDEFRVLLDPQNTIHYPTGFPRLDMALNDGGPGPGEVVIFLAPTNLGKSIWLCNLSVNSVMRGLDTLHITLEMSAHRTARRMVGAMTQKKIKELHINKEVINDQIIRTYNTNKAKLAVFEFNPEEISVEHIRGLLMSLRRTKGWTPKIITIDYLELLMSRRNDYNNEDYIRQKHVAIEICGLAKTELALLYSATQTNRSGSGQTTKHDGSINLIDLNQAAESYGKMMPVDYVISLNQTKEQRMAELPTIDMFIAKNREGPRCNTISCNVNYETMKVMENIV